MWKMYANSGVISVNHWRISLYVMYCFRSSNTVLNVWFTGKILKSNPSVVRRLSPAHSPSKWRPCTLIVAYDKSTKSIVPNMSKCCNILYDLPNKSKKRILRLCLAKFELDTSICQWSDWRVACVQNKAADIRTNYDVLVLFTLAVCT